MSANRQRQAIIPAAGHRGLAGPSSRPATSTPGPAAPRKPVRPSPGDVCLRPVGTGRKPGPVRMRGTGCGKKPWACRSQLLGDQGRQRGGGSPRAAPSGFSPMENVHLGLGNTGSLSPKLPVHRLRSRLPHANKFLWWFPSSRGRPLHPRKGGGRLKPGETAAQARPEIPSSKRARAAKRPAKEPFAQCLDT